MIADEEIRKAGPNGQTATAMEHDESRKLALECRKLELETANLRRSGAWYGILAEVLKAAVVPAALAGTAITFFLGYKQLQHTEVARQQEAFEQILLRLGSDSSKQRLAGVYGMRTLTTSDNATSRKAAAHYLVQALAVEEDPVVQDSILEVFSTMVRDKQSSSLLIEVLSEAVARNRSVSEAKRRRLWHHAEQAAEKLQSDASSSPRTSPYLGRQLKYPPRVALQLAAASNQPWGTQDGAPSGPALQGLGQLVALLVRGGVKLPSMDYSGVFCEGCDFSSPWTLEGANFSRSFLARANFSGQKLTRASFRDADLAGADMSRSDLRYADLSHSDPGAVHSASGLAEPFPFLECADLRGANISGRPIALLIREFVPNSQPPRLREPVEREGLVPALRNIVIDRATKADFTYVVHSRISDSFLALPVAQLGLSFDMMQSLAEVAIAEPQPGASNGIYRVPSNAGSFVYRQANGIPTGLEYWAVAGEIVGTPLAKSTAGEEILIRAKDRGFNLVKPTERPSVDCSRPIPRFKLTTSIDTTVGF